MTYDITKPTAPTMPNLGKGVECIKLLASQITPDMREAVVPMLFPALGAYVSGSEFQYADLTWKEICGQMAHLIADSGMGKGQLTASIEAIMRKFRQHDEDELQKLVVWQKAVKTKGANKEKPARPDVAFFFPPSDVTNPAFLQNADKIGWLQKTVLRVNPSRQSFHTAQTAGDGADDRLVINLNPSVFNGCVDIVADVGTHAHLTSHFAAVDLYKGVTAVPDAVAGNFCVIAGGTGGDIIVVRCRIYAAAVVDTSVTQVKDLLMRLLNPFHQIFFF